MRTARSTIILWVLLLTTFARARVAFTNVSPDRTMSINSHYINDVPNPPPSVITYYQHNSDTGSPVAKIIDLPWYGDLRAQLKATDWAHFNDSVVGNTEIRGSASATVRGSAGDPTESWSGDAHGSARVFRHGQR